MTLREEILAHTSDKVLNVELERGTEYGYETIDVEVSYVSPRGKNVMHTSFAKKNKMSGEDIATVINSFIKSEWSKARLPADEDLDRWSAEGGNGHNRS